MKFVRVDSASGEAKVEETPAEYDGWGNRGLIAKILLAEVPARCHPHSLAGRRPTSSSTSPKRSWRSFGTDSSLDFSLRSDEAAGGAEESTADLTT
jgi:hypothetical protein